MIKKRFVLTLTIEGESLQEIDDGLVQAAGQRLMARMENPPVMNMKDGDGKTKLKTKLKVEEVKPPVDKSSLRESPAGKILQVVYEKLGETGVSECFTKFSIQSLRDLADDQKEAFIGYCDSILEQSTTTPETIGEELPQSVDTQSS